MHPMTLFFIYRNALTTMVPLIMIGIFLVTAQGVLTGLAELRVCVSAQSLSS